MTNRLIILIFLLLQYSFVLFAQKKTDTLISDEGKRVSITYSVERKETTADILFEKCYVYDNDFVLLFSTSQSCDQIDKKKSTLPLDSIVSTSNFEIQQLNNPPNLHTLNGNGNSGIKILKLNIDKDYQIHFPIYLATSEKKKYALKDLCHLSIKIPKMVNSVKSNQKQTIMGNQENIVNSSDNYLPDDADEGDGDNEDYSDESQEEDDKIEKIKEQVEKDLQAAESLLQADSSTINLGDAKKRLGNYRDQLIGHDSDDLIKRIDETINRINDKIVNIEKDKEQKAEAIAKQEAEAAQQRNMWMIIGGIILAILGFVGNQAFQHYRNVRNEKNMMSMQQSIVRRAEDEAKRRAQSMARQKVNQAQNAARRKSQDYVRGSINSGINKISKGKKNKGISI